MLGSNGADKALWWAWFIRLDQSEQRSCSTIELFLIWFYGGHYIKRRILHRKWGGIRADIRARAFKQPFRLFIHFHHGDIICLFILCTPLSMKLLYEIARQRFYRPESFLLFLLILDDAQLFQSVFHERPISLWFYRIILLLRCFLLFKYSVCFVFLKFNYSKFYSRQKLCHIYFYINIISCWNVNS